MFCRCQRLWLGRLNDSKCSNQWTGIAYLSYIWLLHCCRIHCITGCTLFPTGDVAIFFVYIQIVMRSEDVVQLHNGFMVHGSFDILVRAPFFASPLSLLGLVLNTKLEESGMGHINLEWCPQMRMDINNWQELASKDIANPSTCWIEIVGGFIRMWSTVNQMNMR